MEAAGAVERGVPAGRHLRPTLRSGVLRPRLRLLRARAPGPSGRGARGARRLLRPGGTHDCDRGGPRLGLLPSRQRGGARRHQLPDPVAASGGRQRTDRTGTVPPAPRRGVRERGGVAPDGLRRFEPAPAGRRLHPEDLHGDDRGGPRHGPRGRPHRRPDLRRGDPALYRTAEADGVFCYTFFKAVGTRPARAATAEAEPAGGRRA